MEVDMQATQHVMQRMSQRGVTGEMVDFVINNGSVDQDKYVVGKKQALDLLNDLRKQERVIKKILDKGGVTVVAIDDFLITTYNCSGQKR